MKRGLAIVFGLLLLAVVGSFLYFFTGLFASSARAAGSEPLPQKGVLGKNPAKTLQVQLLRHSTMLLSYDNGRLLIDPMLAAAGTLQPIPMTSNRAKNPLIDLPCSQSELLAAFDAVLVTHLHPDHFDAEAERRIPKDTPFLCQPADEKRFAAMGFTHVQAISDSLDWHGLHFSRHDVNHAAEPWLRDQMGKSSAYVISTGTNDVMLTGDAVLDDTLRALISQLKPAHLIANAGGAEMLFGSPITLTPESLQAIVQLSPATHIHAVHMDAINHCRSRKSDLVAFVEKNGLQQSISVPLEGERWEWPKD